MFLAGCVGVPHLGDSDAAIAAEDIIAGERASRLKEITAAPEMSDISYQVGNRRYEASLFLPFESTVALICTEPVKKPDRIIKSRTMTLAMNDAVTLRI